MGKSKKKQLRKKSLKNTRILSKTEYEKLIKKRQKKKKD